MKAGDEGFARNVEKLFGNDSGFQGLDLAPLKSVTLSEDKSKLTFEFDGAPSISYGVEGECCSSSWIEHLDVPPYVLGEKITAVEDLMVDTPDSAQAADSYEVLQSYQTRFVTPKGTIVLEYRNSSNGYYGGHLVRFSN